MAALPDYVGKFRIDGLLGRGAMGVVFKAHDPDIDRTVAIKLIRTDLLDGEDRAHYVARFRNEAKMVGRCIHPNIVGIYDFSTHDGSPFLVLEYVEGHHLGRYLGRGERLDPVQAGRAMLQVLNALAYAHEFGVIHRDIKPANILLTTGSTIKVTDFGISRALLSDATMSSVLVGTPSYMSPEQCLGGTIDGRSDLFSLGCVFYEILSGERAFPGANYVETTNRILHGAPAPLAQCRPDLSAAIVGVVDRALARQAEDRYQDARGMADALRDALRAADAEPEPADADAPDAADATIVVASTHRPAETGASAEIEALNPKSLGSIERRLAFYVGPIARHHLRHTMSKAKSPEDLCRMIAELVPAGRDRDELQGSILGILSSDTGLRDLRSRSAGPASLPGARPISASDEARYGKALTQILGPVAPLLLRRALSRATTLGELEAACISLIDQEAETARFRSLIQ